MRCWLFRHKFKPFYDVIVGGVLGRHVKCDRCKTEYSILWHVDKPHRPKGGSLRIKISSVYL